MNKKVKYIFIFSILAVLGIVYAVLYIINPEQTKSVSKTILDYICTKPLPVISMSILGLTLAVMKVVSVSALGNKQIKICKDDLKESEEQRTKTHAELLSFEEKLNNKLDEFKENHNEQLRQICENIPNKNVKELGEKFYGKEENSESVEE